MWTMTVVSPGVHRSSSHMSRIRQKRSRHRTRRSTAATRRTISHREAVLVEGAQTEICRSITDEKRHERTKIELGGIALEL